MAEVDFGDIELFQQLDDSMPVSTHIRFTENEVNQEEVHTFKQTLGEYEETIQKLAEENQDLKRKLRILSRPSGLIVDNIKTDGPLLQILFGNNSISKQCRQEIEDCICSVIQKHQQPRTDIPPQTSSLVMEEDQKSPTPCSIKTIKEAFSMVGSVLYFTTFCLDKLGQPLLNDNPQLTDGWTVPTYQQVFSQVIALDGQDVQIKEKRPKACCFNCGSTEHQLRDCPVPKDMARINEKRKLFSQGNNQMLGNQRYHAEEVEERFAKYKPGIISEDLFSALGGNPNTLPPFIYRMRQLGYPPGWLKEAEMENSGLTLYDGSVSSDGDLAEDSDGHRISYDVSKLVEFPGFNVPAPPSVKDEYRLYGSIPMQQNHLKENYSVYLSSSFPTPGSKSNKRRHESDSTPRQVKKRRSSPGVPGSDMDVDSDPSTPRRHQSADSFQFQPPLPPASPFGSPPPLPLGTPPATPTPPPVPKGTPPLTPTNGSPALHGRGWVGGEEAGPGEEDALTLEELEEQQRLIWAALENADTATNSDSETPATGTPATSSPSVSTPAHIATETEMEDGEAEVEPRLAQLSSPDQADEEAEVEEPSLAQLSSPDQADEEADVEEPSLTQLSSPDQADEEADVEEPSLTQLSSPDQAVEEADVEEPSLAQLSSPDQADVEELAEEPSTLHLEKKASPESPDPGQRPVAAELSESVGKVTAVPHRSKFAEGIIPFEDTPEFTEVAEATGTYLRIRGLLKSSPRNLSKIKK